MENKGLRIFSDTIKKSFYALRMHFTFRAFLTLLFGLALLAANIGFFIAAVIYAFNDFSIGVIFFFLMGLLGLAVSCFMIFYISLYNAATPKSERDMSGSGGTLLSQARAHKGKDRKKKIAIALAVYAAIWLVGIGAFGYYFIDKAQYNRYIETSAEVVELISTGSGEDDGYKCKYKYEVGGETYYADGNVESSGAAVPQIGDATIIKYNPDNPEQIYLATEKKFFLLFGSFFLFIGFLLVLYEFVAAGKFSMQFFLAYILLGISCIAISGPLINYQPDSLLQYLARNPWIFFVMIFGNMGLIMLFEGLMPPWRVERKPRKRR